MASNSVTIKILGDPSGAKRAFGEVENSASGFGSKMVGVGKMVGAGLGAAAVGAVALGNEVLNTGAKLAAWRQKTSVVFEGQADDVRKWADANNESFGLTDDELSGLAAGFGDLLKPMGFTSGQAADMSKKVVGLSGALSSWSGGTKTAAEVSDILAKAMLGERDGLKALGISITDADVKSRLAAKGQEKLTGAALEQAKALATQELIFEKSTDAQKAWAAGGNPALAASNKLKAGFAELKEQIADKLLPVVLKVVEWAQAKLPGAIAAAKPILKSLVEAFQTIVAAVKDNWPKIQEIIQNVMETIRTVIDGVVSVITTMWDNFGNNIWEFVQRVWPPIQQVISGVMNVIQGVIKTVTSLIKGDWRGVWEGIKQVFSGVWQAIQGAVKVGFEALRAIIGVALEVIGSMWKGAWGGIKGAFGAVWDGIKSIAVGAVNFMTQNVINPLIRGLNLLITGFNRLPGVPNLPMIAEIARIASGSRGSDTSVSLGGGVRAMAEGGMGTVSKPTLFLAGEAGTEDFAFGPHSKGGLGGMGTVNVTINMPPGSDGQDVVDAITRWERRNGKLYARA